MRTFIAFALPDSLITYIKNIQTALKGSSIDAKWVSPQNCHLTIKFLGDTSISQIPAIENELSDILKTQSAVETTLTEIGVFPSWQKPNVLWLRLNDPNRTISHIAQTMDDKLFTFGFKKESRNFKPHITLARIKSGKNIKNLEEAVRKLTLPSLKFHLKEIVLYQSTLTAQGSLYQPLKSYSLC